MSAAISRKAASINPSSTLAITARAKELVNQGVDVIGFGAGEPDFDTPEHIKEAAVAAIRSGFTKYTPANGMQELREAICEKLERDNGLNYSPEQIVVSNGAKHSLDNVFAVLLNEGDEVIIPTPYWVSYPELVKLNSGTPVVAETGKETDHKLNGHKLKEALTPRTRALIINSPCNPTGKIYNREELEEIAALAVENEIYIISDEVYEKLVYGDNRHISIASLGEEIKKLTVTVNGASKTYSMTGWRIGYTSSEKEIASAMGSIQSHAASNPNAVAQKAVLEALRAPQDCVEEMRLAFEERRDFMVSRIDDMPLLSCIRPEGAFYMFVNIEKTFGSNFKGEIIKDGHCFAKHLLEHFKVAVVPGDGFGAPNYVRLSYALAMPQIEKGLSRMGSFLEELEAPLHSREV